MFKDCWQVKLGREQAQQQPEDITDGARKTQGFLHDNYAREQTIFLAHPGALMVFNIETNLFIDCNNQ